MENGNTDKTAFAEEMVGLLNQGKVEEAIQSIRERLDMKPEDDSLHYLMGNAYRRQSNWQMALEHYAEAVELNPDSPAKQAKAMLTDILNYRCKELLNP